MPVVSLIHLIATVYFYKKGYYRSQSFTIKHLVVALFFPIAGMALITFEYVMNLSKGGIDVASFLLILSLYGLLVVIFAIPYLLHLRAAKK
ncbi:hypothetical protein AOC03_08225 [Psychrobacter urativorans]|uniref:Uncharacterized protein n=2 Tax=Psychrobacter urativorans TaxID=45610 RepID=A0A0M3V951_9GAMM|nr:hypothetical protein AOC03_08225 [Psychrobacter urativorans]